MDQTAREKCGIISAKESLPEFGKMIDRQDFSHPLFYQEIYKDQERWFILRARRDCQRRCSGENEPRTACNSDNP